MSARVMRDDEESGFYEAWTGSSRLRKKQGFSPGYGIALIAAATVVVLCLPGSGDGDGADRPGAAARMQEARSAGIRGSLLSRVLPGSGRTATSVRMDFGSGSGGRMSLGNWRPRVEMASSDWQQLGKSMRVGSMRLWQPTMALADYNVSFGAEIETKAVSWAVRAADHGSYYATKIGVDASRERAEITRYTMLGGESSPRVQRPIPVRFEKGKVYEVAMRVSGSKFITLVNGQMVDSWSDSQLKRGGVGFFAENGEKANLHWVNVDERASFMERFLSFSFLITPWELGY